MAVASFGDIWFRCCLDRQGCNVVLFLLREEVADWSAVNGLEIFICTRNFIIRAMAVSTPMRYSCFRTHVGSSQRWGHTRVWAGRATVQDIRGQAEFDGYYYNQFLVVIIYIASESFIWTFTSNSISICLWDICSVLKKFFYKRVLF